jgi:ribosomal protein S18 acetylase RimI-like enzyme
MFIEPILAHEHGFLEEMLFEALYVEKGQPKFSKSILKEPSLRRYFDEFGSGKMDVCLVAVHDEKLVGVVWGRQFTAKEKGYGFVDIRTPELSMSVKEPFRGRGFGSALLSEIIQSYQLLGIKSISLSVHKKNKAFQLYTKLGFTIVHEEDISVIMKKMI